MQNFDTRQSQSSPGFLAHSCQLDRVPRTLRLVLSIELLYISETELKGGAR